MTAVSTMLPIARCLSKEELRVYESCPLDGELFKDFVVP